MRHSIWLSYGAYQLFFVIENNQYAMGTSVIRSSAETELHKRGSSFEIKGIQVDGMNVLEVRDAAKKSY